jgi:IS30 family transposase
VTGNFFTAEEEAKIKSYLQQAMSLAKVAQQQNQVQSTVTCL